MINKTQTGRIQTIQMRVLISTIAKLMQEWLKSSNQIYLDDAMFSKEYKKRYKDTMQKYRKHCK